MTNIDNLTLTQDVEIQKNYNVIPITNEGTYRSFYPTGKYVLIRTHSAGVHVGFLEECEGKILKLSKSRRIWSWRGAFTLSEIANNGVGIDSKLSEKVPEIILTEAIEIIPCSEKATKILENFKVYTP